jgi:S1-C subfamily serine protease
MALQFSCPECFSAVSVNSQHAGKRVKCPTCGSAVQVPAAGSRQAAPVATGSRGAGKKKKKSSSGGSNGLVIGLAVGGGVAVLAAVGVIAFMAGRSGTPAPAETNTIAASTPAAASPMPTPAPAPAPTAGATVPVSLAGSATPEVIEPVPTADAGSAAAGTPSSGETAPQELPLKELIKKVEQSVVRILVKSPHGMSAGSGFVVDTDGTIITNYHVVEGANSAEAEFNTGERTKVVGFWKLDDTRDIAVVKVDFPAEKLLPISLAAILPEKGDKVAAFGAPLNLAFTASDGIVSALRTAKELQQKAGTFVQTTAPISPGNSGGPLVNMRGEVVGVNSFKRADGENLNFAICSLDVQDVLQQKGTSLTQISPETVPVKIHDVGSFRGAENLVGTERGRLLLSQIREAVVVVAQITQDPTGRISDYLETTAENTIVKRVGWESVRRQSDFHGSTALVYVVTFFQVGDDTTDENLVTELVIRIQVVARDVSKEGVETVAIVYDDKQEVGTASLKSLVEGRISRTLESAIKSYFSRFSTACKKAVNEAEAQP